MWSTICHGLQSSPALRRWYATCWEVDVSTQVAESPGIYTYKVRIESVLQQYSQADFLKADKAQGLKYGLDKSW